MKIGFVTSTLENSGPINILFNLVKYLKNIENIIIYTLGNEKKNTRIQEFIKLGCSVKCLNMKNMDILLKKPNLFEDILKKDKIDILHAHCFRSTLLISKIRNKKIKKVTTLHANVGLDYKINFGVIKGSIMKKIYYNSLKRIDLNIACSKSILEFYKNKNIKLDYIQNGVDLNIFKKNNEKINLRKKLGLEEGVIYFISVGSLCKRKNPLFIAKKISALKKLNIKVIFLGEGEEEKELLEIKSSQVVLRGKVNNVREYLEASDYFVSSSKSEGLPNSVVEALAIRLPVLLSNIGPHKEIIDLNKDAGEIFDLEKKGDFIQKLNILLEKDYNTLAKEAYSIVENSLNAELMSKKYFDRYKKLML